MGQICGGHDRWVSEHWLTLGDFASFRTQHAMLTIGLKEHYRVEATITDAAARADYAGTFADEVGACITAILRCEAAMARLGQPRPSIIPKILLATLV